MTVLDVRTRPEALAGCHRAVAAGAAAVVALGGDGTVHLALQALATTGVALGIVPAGTGNDFAVAVGVSPDPATATTRLATAMAAGTVRPIDLGRIDGAGSATRWFGAVFSAGFDAVVNERANRMTFPRGPRRYDLATLVELAGLRARDYRLRLDGVTQPVAAVLVAVGNTSSFGGGMRICPDADPTDGQLDVVIGHRMGRATLIGLLPKVYRGEHVHHPLVTVARAATVEVHVDAVTAYADGERIAALPLTLTCVPGALTLLT